MHHIDWFPYIEESLHSWNKLSLIKLSVKVAQLLGCDLERKKEVS